MIDVMNSDDDVTIECKYDQIQLRNAVLNKNIPKDSIFIYTIDHTYFNILQLMCKKIFRLLIGIVNLKKNIRNH